MINYFGYGSNINFTSLKAKGVVPVKSELAVLKAWKLVFNVRHWFRHEGGVGNIIETGQPDDYVEGIVHLCDEEDLSKLDLMESYGEGYDRVEVELETASGRVTAYTYVGLPPFVDDSCLPTKRYLNIILQGARSAGLSPKYIDKLERQELFKPRDYPLFKANLDSGNVFDEKSLSKQKQLTALCGYVFDMSKARKELHCLFDLIGSKDMTLFHLKRLDTSNGQETIEDVLNDRISDYAKNYLNAYLHEYNHEFELIGSYDYS